MPIVDMPLSELKKYMGTNPKPKDFNEYWDRAIKELDGTEPNPELIPSDFKTPFAECYDLYFTGVKGARIHAKFLQSLGI